MTDTVQFFREELQRTSSSAAYHLEVLRRTGLVASALGPSYTRQLLLPVLKELHESADDELLHALCSEYRKLYSFVGGSEFVQLLVDPLEMLLQQEETVVREQAVACLCDLMESSCAESNVTLLMQNVYIPLLQRVSKKDKWFTSRVSACGLLTTMYALCTDGQHQEDIRSVFFSLCRDETPMVKRAAAQHAQKFFRVVDKGHILESLLPAFQSLWLDDTQDGIRVYLLNGLAELSEKLSPEENKQTTLPLLLSSADDRSWRVRLQLAKLLDKFAVVVGVNSLLPSFQNLLKDSEQDVRVHSAKAIGKVAALLPREQVVTSIVPSLYLLAKDPVYLVRSELARVTVELCQDLGSEFVEEHLLTILSNLLKDEHFDVKLNIISQAGDLFSAADPICCVVLSSVKSLMDDAQWRIRLAVVQLLPTLAHVLGMKTFESRLQSTFFLGLLDNVHAVREAAINAIESLTKSFGPEWTVNALTPKIVDIYNSSMICNLGKSEPSQSSNEKPRSYMTRITVLMTLPNLATVMTAKEVAELLLPVISKAFRDPVPNVRFSGAKIGAWLATHGLLDIRAVQQEISSALLQMLEEDQDIDVRYFCNQAIIDCQH